MTNLSNNQNNVLVVDCANEHCGVLLNTDKKYFYAQINPLSATEKLTPTINYLTKSANINLQDIKLIIWNRGPGSFTAIRIASSIVQGLATPFNIPIIGISAFEFYMSGLEFAQNNIKILCAIDARCSELYWTICEYSCSLSSWKLFSTINVSSDEEIFNIISKQGINLDYKFGNGFETMGFFKKLQEIKLPQINIMEPEERLLYIARNTILANYTNIGELHLPLYIRNSVAQKLSEQKVWYERISGK